MRVWASGSAPVSALPPGLTNKHCTLPRRPSGISLFSVIPKAIGPSLSGVSDIAVKMVFVSSERWTRNRSMIIMMIENKIAFFHTQYISTHIVNYFFLLYHMSHGLATEFIL